MCPEHIGGKYKKRSIRTGESTSFLLSCGANRDLVGLRPGNTDQVVLVNVDHFL